MEQNLFKPSLGQEGVAGEYNFQNRVYHMGRMLYVAFFLGVVPTAILSAKNIMALRLSRTKLYILSGLGVLLFIGGIMVTLNFNPLVGGALAEHYRTARWGVRIAHVLYYLFCYNLMKNEYHFHINMDGECKPLLWEALGWTVLGNMVTYVIVKGVGAIYG